MQYNTSAQVICIITCTICSGPLNQYIPPLASDTVRFSQRFDDLWIMLAICPAGSFLTGSDLCHSTSHTLCPHPVQYWALLQVPIQELLKLAYGHSCLKAKAKWADMACSRSPAHQTQCLLWGLQHTIQSL